MKKYDVDENCIQQIYRLFKEWLYTGKPILADDLGRVRIDDLEMRAEIQKEVSQLWNIVDSNNVTSIADVEGYNSDFLKLFGFGIDDVDYSADVDIDLNLPQ